MANFIKWVFASCLGSIIASIVFLFLGFGLIAGVASFADSKEKSAFVEDNSILALRFNKAIPEKTDNVESQQFSFEPERIVGLQDYRRAIEKAATDDKIKGIFLDLEGISTGQATASILREALQNFKKSGKFIYAYGDYFSQGTYNLASTADSIFLNPMGGMDFRGFGGQIPFFKNMLDRLGVKMQIYYAGQFKSATEPFRLEKMSDQNRLQVREYLEGLYDIYLTDIAESRKIAKTELRLMANEYRIKEAEDAVSNKLVDKLAYRDEVLAALKRQLKLKEDDKIKTTSIETYSKNVSKNYKSSDKLAIIYAEGSIVDGEGDYGSIGGDKYARIIRKIRQENKVKGIVLRINSGGGSALASEKIWRELTLARQEGLPVIVSMGDLAASGGYYIACNADSILAEPNTITGSIGVFSMIPSLQKTLKDKVGVTFDTIKTGKYSVGISPFFDISEDEGKVLQASTDRIYETFLKRVADGRSMSRDDVHNIAQGRVWTGIKASKNGLVDAMGDLNDAIDIAAKKAGLTDYRIAEYPETKEPLQKLIDDIMKKDKEVRIKENILRAELGETYELYKEIENLKKMKGVQARMPYKIEIQ